VNKPADNVSASAPTNADTNLDSTTSDSTNSDSTSSSATIPNDRKRRRGLGRKGLLIAAAASIGLVGVGGGTAAAMSKEVVITVDGQQREVTTLAGSVNGALETAGLQVGAHDIVAPAANASISDGSHIALERARPLDLTINGKERQLWTTADTVDQALVQLGQDPAALVLSADRSREIPLDGIELTANAVRTVSISDAGRPAKKVSTGAKTVADVLKEQGVTLAAADTTEPALTTAVKDGQQIKVSRVVIKTVTQTVDIAPKDVRTDDPKLDKGSTVVAAKGKPGKQKVVTTITTVNGKETSRKEVSRTTVAQATPNQIRVGTKSGLDVQGGRVFFHDTEFGVNWDGLAYCESTNNPNAVNNPAGFLSTYGLFQFDLPTWQSVGGSGNPGDASPEEQLKRAKLLFQQRGLEPWLCGYAASGPPAG
jgi:uncharacterized protein YabE (DUF348 family)